MLKSFKDIETQNLWEEKACAIPQDIKKRAFNKLAMINASTSLTDLRSPPGNRLESLSGKREGQFSIRINDQYRICFRWSETDAYDVEITDYH